MNTGVIRRGTDLTLAPGGQCQLSSQETPCPEGPSAAVNRPGCFSELVCRPESCRSEFGASVGSGAGATGSRPSRSEATARATGSQAASLFCVSGSRASDELTRDREPRQRAGVEESPPHIGSRAREAEPPSRGRRVQPLRLRWLFLLPHGWRPWFGRVWAQVRPLWQPGCCSSVRPHSGGLVCGGT